jgi:DNA-binding NarL/FixJ family response regulator
LARGRAVTGKACEDMACAWHALIVDPDPADRTFVARALEEDGYVVNACKSGEEALGAARAEPPQLAILEVNTGDTCGYEVCRVLRESLGDAIAIMFISGDRHGPADRVAGLLLGADDFIAKPVNRDELRARAQVLLRRVRPARSSGAVGTEFGLTARELEVLQLLADGLDQATIARRLVISPKTVGKHIERVLDKLSAHSRAEVVSIAHRRGLASGHGAVALREPRASRAAR